MAYAEPQLGLAVDPAGRGRTRLITRLATVYEWRRPLALVTVLLMECADRAEAQ